LMHKYIQYQKKVNLVIEYEKKVNINFFVQNISHLEQLNYVLFILTSFLLIGILTLSKF